MTEDQIKQFAQESGLTDKDLGDWMTDYGLCKGEILEFAELIAKAEREECAKVCDNISGSHWFDFKNAPMSDLKRGNVYVEGQSDGADDCANAIRARGGK